MRRAHSPENGPLWGGPELPGPGNSGASPVRWPRTEKKTTTPPESLGRQVAGDDAERAEHGGPEPSLTAGPDQFLVKSSSSEFSDHCTPTPSGSVSTTTASVARTCPTPAATTGTPNSRLLAGSFGSDRCSIAFAAA